MRILLKVETPLSTTINVSTNTYAYLSKIKDKHTSKGRKSIARDKNLKETFYLIFLT
jgi:hypothetical protein